MSDEPVEDVELDIPEDLHQQIMAAAQAMGISVEDFIVKALTAFVNKETPEQDGP